VFPGDEISKLYKIAFSRAPGRDGRRHVACLVDGDDARIDDDQVREGKDVLRQFAEVRARRRTHGVDVHPGPDVRRRHRARGRGQRADDVRTVEHDVAVSTGPLAREIEAFYRSV